MIKFPKKYFEYFLGTINIQAHSVQEVCHKRQPHYVATTHKIAYKIFDAHSFLMPLLLAGNLSIEEEDDDVLVSAEELIAKAKQRLHTIARQPLLLDMVKDEPHRRWRLCEIHSADDQHPTGCTSDRAGKCSENS